ncbi:MAG TPA: hypothetical protein VGX26_04100 [Solirubrobacteraceae bacterium]|jgi:hypothetical protein|nr:hypothetical protein [Solirubrobacteraceae bacterium]
MLATFDGTWDWTAIGTLALAAATFVSLYFARRSLGQTQKQIKLGQAQLEQTQREIELSRSEVEEAHRPVLVPVVDSTSYMDLGADGAGRERRPQLEPGGHLFVPVENIGSGPALNVEASVSGTSVPEEARTEHQTSARVAGLGEGRFLALLVELPFWKELWTFTLTIEYSDVAGKGWRTNALFLRDTGRYDAVTISACERQRPLSDMVKPVPTE